MYIPHETLSQWISPSAHDGVAMSLPLLRSIGQGNVLRISISRATNSVTHHDAKKLRSRHNPFGGFIDLPNIC